MFEEGKKENQGKLVSVIFPTQINVSKIKTSHLLYKFLKIFFCQFHQDWVQLFELSYSFYRSKEYDFLRTGLNFSSQLLSLTDTSCQ